MPDLTAAVCGVANKEPFAVRCPLRYPDMIQLLRSDDLDLLVPQGANFYGTLGASLRDEARSIGRNIPVQRIVRVRLVFRTKVKPGELRTSAFDGVEGRDDHLFVILALLRNGTQVGRGPGAGTRTIFRHGKYQFRRPTGDGHAHEFHWHRVAARDRANLSDDPLAIGAHAGHFD